MTASCCQSEYPGRRLVKSKTRVCDLNESPPGDDAGTVASPRSPFFILTKDTHTGDRRKQGREMLQPAQARHINHVNRSLIGAACAGGLGVFSIRM